MILLFQSLLLQSGANPDTINLIFFGAMILIFWLFLIRPQARKQREQRNFMESLQKGEEVVTSSGIIGRINKMDGEVITLEIANKVFIRVLKNSISKEMTDAIYGADKSKKPATPAAEDTTD